MMSGGCLEYDHLMSDEEVEQRDLMADIELQISGLLEAVGRIDYQTDEGYSSQKVRNEADNIQKKAALISELYERYLKLE